MAKMDIIQEIEEEIAGLRWLLRQWFTPNSCVISSALICQILEQHGLVGFPLSCVVMVMNEIAAEYMAGQMERTDHETNDQRLDQTMHGLAALPGAYIVGIGLQDGSGRFDIEGNKWIGHLIVIAIDPTKDQKWLIDVTIDQADRPDHAIRCQPYITAIDNHMLGSSFTITSHIDGINTTMLYDPQWGDLSYQATADWQNAAGDLGRVCTNSLMGYLLQMAALRRLSNPDRSEILNKVATTTKAAIRLLKRPLSRFDPAQVIINNKGGKQ